jgi:hypothetical protein
MVHVGAEAADLPVNSCTETFVGPALQYVDKPLTK